MRRSNNTTKCPSYACIHPSTRLPACFPRPIGVHAHAHAHARRATTTCMCTLLYTASCSSKKPAATFAGIDLIDLSSLHSNTVRRQILTVPRWHTRSGSAHDEFCKLKQVHHARARAALLDFEAPGDGVNAPASTPARRMFFFFRERTVQRPPDEAGAERRPRHARRGAGRGASSACASVSGRTCTGCVRRSPVCPTASAFGSGRLDRRGRGAAVDGLLCGAVFLHAYALTLPSIVFALRSMQTHISMQF